MLEQVLEGGVGVEVALEVSVVAVGDVVGVGVLGACALGDSFSCGGDEFGVCEVLEGAVGFWSCGVEGCGGDEVLEVVYWVCVVVLPIGLSHLVMLSVCHSGDRDTRWVFCCSRGCGCGDVKMADVRPLSHQVGEGLGVRAKSGRTLHTANSRNVPLSDLKEEVFNHSVQVESTRLNAESNR